MYLSTYYMLDTIVSARDAVVNKTDKLWPHYILVAEWRGVTIGRDTDKN